MLKLMLQILMELLLQIHLNLEHKVEYDFGSVGLNNIGYESVTASYSIEIISNPLNTIEKGVEVATNNSFYNSRLIDYSQDNNSSVNVTGLDFNTSYFVRSFVENEYGIFYSEYSEFKTLDTNYEFTSILISDVYYSNAKISVGYEHINTVEPEILEKGVYISEDVSLLDSSQSKVLVQSQDFSYNFTGLKQNTTYYYKVFIKNKYKEVKSLMYGFTTQNASPTFSFNLLSENIDFDKITPLINIDTKNLTSISSLDFEILNGNVIVQKFDYLSSYDQSFNGGDIFIPITNLNNSSYSIRLKLTNQYGVFNSSIYSFSTKDDTPFMKIVVFLEIMTQIVLT